MGVLASVARFTGWWGVGDPKYRILKDQFDRFKVQRKWLCFWLDETHQDGTTNTPYQDVTKYFNTRPEAEAYIDLEVKRTQASVWVEVT